MRAVVQRVIKASVEVDNELISSIGKGICVLIGISRDDTKADVDYMIRKLLNLRIFESNDGNRWSQSVKDKQYEILVVSQFTLYCVLKGNKPDFHSSMGADKAEIFYNEFIAKLRQAYVPDLVKDGRFGTYRHVSIQNDGPVTINLESPIKEPKETANSSSLNREGEKKEC